MPASWLILAPSKEMSLATSDFPQLVSHVLRLHHNEAYPAKLHDLQMISPQTEEYSSLLIYRLLSLEPWTGQGIGIYHCRAVPHLRVVFKLQAKSKPFF